MPVTVECPHCRAKVTVAEKMIVVTCMNCVTKFDRTTATAIVATPKTPAAPPPKPAPTTLTQPVVAKRGRVPEILTNFLHPCAAIARRRTSRAQLWPERRLRAAACR